MKKITCKGLKLILFEKSIQCEGMNMFINRKPSERDVRFIVYVYQKGRNDKMKDINFEMNNEEICEIDTGEEV